MKFCHIHDHDVIYEGLRIDIVLAYMVGTKQKDAHGLSEKIYSFTHMQKVHDVILLGH